KAVVFQHALHLRLLQHDLRDQNGVGIRGPPPWQVTSMTAIPLAQALLKCTLLLPIKCHVGRPDYRSSPKVLRSSGPSLVTTTPSPCTILRISSTTSGLARVVTSPIFMVLEIDAKTRRIIFPERVLGISGTMYTCLGLAIGPMIVSMARTTFCSTALSGAIPGLRDTYISGTRPRKSSATGTTAASAISSTVRLADSSSFVPNRWPATLITSSTRPRMR